MSPATPGIDALNTPNVTPSIDGGEASAGCGPSPSRNWDQQPRTLYRIKQEATWQRPT